MRAITEVALFTDDVVGAAAFYRSLVDAAPVAEWPGGALFAAGDTKILVHERAATTEGGPPNEDHFALSVDEIDAVCDTLRAEGLESSRSRMTTRGDDRPISAIPTAVSSSSRKPESGNAFRPAEQRRSAVVQSHP